MAVTVLKNPSSLRLKYDFGKDQETQKRIIKSKSYGSLKPDADAQKCYEVATSIASLITEDAALIEIQKLDNSTIAE